MAIETTPPTGVTPSPVDLESLHLLINGYRVSQAIAVVARLGIADLLTDGPRDIGELAALTATHGPSLGRVLRLLAGAGLFEEVAPRRFALTALGAGLRTGVPGSRHSTALLLDSAQWQAWDDLLYSVETGETAWDHVHGTSQYDYYQANPTAGETFQQAMTARLAGAATALVEAYEFCPFERIVDIGGGQGGLLAAVLQACPSARGVVFDRPEVVAGAPALLERAGVSERCEVVGGDFFEAVPRGGDAYLLRQVLHDWADPPALRILRNCRAAMGPASRLLVVERVITGELRACLAELEVDVEMLVAQGGMERSEAEYRALFAQAGFRLTAVLPVGERSHFSVFEAVPA